MTMAWVAVGVGVLGAGASVYGANKQASASKQAAGMNMDMFNTLNGQQQPYIRSGYGAMSKLNTLLGINPGPGGRQMPAMPGAAPSQAYAPTPGGGVDPRMQVGPSDQSGQPPPRWNVPEANMPNLQLRNILSMRAAHGDSQARMMLQRLA
jgi:hypothetical protein